MMQYRELAFEKVEYWVKSNINNFKKEKTEIPEVIRFAIRVLATRPDLFQYVYFFHLISWLEERVWMRSRLLDSK